MEKEPKDLKPMPLSQNQTAFLEQKLSLKLGTNIIINDSAPMAGGSINEAFDLKCNQGKFFVKFNEAKKYPKMFEAEAKGLALLKSTKSIPIPEVLLIEHFEGMDYLVLEFIQEGAKSNDFWRNFGANLARLHQNSNEQFGLDHSNYIGSLPQTNAQHSNWNEFFIYERILPKVKTARDQGLLNQQQTKQFEQAFKIWESGFFPEEVPSLIHGDLWSGNFRCNAEGQAAIFDPAIYYGHREVDLAMTHLFSGFAPAFYEAYQETFPLEKGINERLPIYNLYPLMVHLLLFGRSYLSQIKSTISVF